MKRYIVVVIALLASVFAMGCTASEPAYTHLLEGNSAGNPLYFQVAGGTGGLAIFTHGLGSDNHTPCTLAELSALITDDDLVGLSATQELDNKTLDSSIAKGTWTTSGTWIVPSYTLSGGITTNSQYLIGNSNNINISTSASGKGIYDVNNWDGAYGVTWITKHNSATPAINDTLFNWEIQGNQGDGSSVAYGNIKFRIADNTTGSADGKFLITILENGVENEALYLTSDGTLYVDNAYDTFDEFDDAELLREGISKGNKQLMLDSGVLEVKRDKDNRIVEGEYMINFQNIIALCAGGVYQNRDKIEALETRISQLEKIISQGGK